MINMNRFFYISLLTLTLTSTVSCKKYLSLNPPSDLSGNNFWKTKQDVEAFLYVPVLSPLLSGGRRRQADDH